MPVSVTLAFTLGSMRTNNLGLPMDSYNDTCVDPLRAMRSSIQGFWPVCSIDQCTFDLAFQADLSCSQAGKYCSITFYYALYYHWRHNGEPLYVINYLIYQTKWYR
jgi:hypothetical protein